MWIAAALAVGAAVFSYIGSRGNPTGSLLLATFEGLQAIQENLVAVNKGLQFLTQLVADMYTHLDQKIDVINLKEYEELHKATLETAVKEIVAYRRTIELADIGQAAVDPVLHYETVGKYFDDARPLRAALLDSSKDHQFAGCMIACYAFRLELEVLSYLIDLGYQVKKKKYFLGHLEEVCRDYKIYLLAAVDDTINGSIASARNAEQAKLDALLAKFGPSADKALPLKPGRYFAGVNQLSSKHFFTTYQDVTHKPGQKPPVEEPAHTNYWYSEYYLVVEETKFGTPETPVSKFAFRFEAQNKWLTTYTDGSKELAAFLKTYSEAPSKFELHPFGDDKNLDDLAARVDEYVALFSEQYFETAANVNNWTLILQAARLTLSDIDCNLELIVEKDASCMSAAVLPLEAA